MSDFVEADTRKARSIKKLKEWSVPYIVHLPVIELEAETIRRTAEEVGVRVICLALVSMKGAGGDHDFIQ